MPSVLVGYVPGSGFSPLISGNPYSGKLEPIGGMQLRAGADNSGAIYVSISGAFFYSGQIGTLPASGGPTINSGNATGSGGAHSGWLDGMPLGRGDAYLLPKICFPGTVSGVWTICIGCDPAASGQARLYYEIF